MTALNVGLLPGSIRSASVSRQLAAALVPLLADHGLDSELIDLDEYPMSLYHGDDEVEQGQPAQAIALCARLVELDGLILVTPEYNGGPSALLKNAIDWVTRVDRSVFKRLLIGLAAASPGQRGAKNGLSVMRSICDHMRLDIVPDDLSIAESGAAFETVGGVPVFARPGDLDAAELFVASYACRLLERSRVESA